MSATRAPMAIRIFGREPAVVLGMVEATIALFVVLFGKQLGLNGEFTVLAMAAISAVVGIWSGAATKDTMLGYMTGLAKAIFGLVMYFGLNIPVETQAALMAFLATAVGFWQRGQTSPVVDPVETTPQQVQMSPIATPKRSDANGDGIADYAEKRG